MSGSLGDVSFSYGFSGLETKNQVVFKSIVALLTGRTSVRWANSEPARADLLVTGVDGSATGTVVARVKLVIGAGESGAMRLGLPLKPAEVLDCLNKAVVALQHVENTGDAPFRILRWPPSGVVGANPAFIRLTTLLAAKEMGLAELSARSGVDLALCRCYLETLREQGLVESVDVAAAPVQADEPFVAEGLFARIRRRIGLVFSSQGE